MSADPASAHSASAHSASADPAPTDLHRHQGWCPNGRPADGRIRLDLFPEWGGAFPVRRGGAGAGDLTLSGPLRADLQAWNDDWEHRAEPGTHLDDDRWRAGWIAEGESLAERVAVETGAVVIVLGPERFGLDPACSHCGPDAARDEVAVDPAVLLDLHFRSLRRVAKQARKAWQAGDLERARTDLETVRVWAEMLRDEL